MRITPWNTIPPASKAWAVFFKVGYKAIPEDTNRQILHLDAVHLF